VTTEALGLRRRGDSFAVNRSPRPTTPTSLWRLALWTPPETRRTRPRLRSATTLSRLPESVGGSAARPGCSVPLPQPQGTLDRSSSPAVRPACLQAVIAPAPATTQLRVTASSGSDPSGALAWTPLWLVRRLGCPRFDCYRLGWCWFGCGCLLGAGVLGQHGFGDAASGRDGNAVLPGPCPDRRGVPTLWPPRTVLATSGARVTGPAQRAAATNCARLCRRLSACSVDRSISYVRPSTANRTVSTASEPSMSSVSWTMVVRANRLPPGRVVVFFAMLGYRSTPVGSLVCAGTRWCAQRHPPAESVSRRLLPADSGCTCCSLSGKQKAERPGWNRLGRQRTAGRRLLAAGRDSSGGTAQLPATRARWVRRGRSRRTTARFSIRSQPRPANSDRTRRAGWQTARSLF